jgi:3-phenylpropionate/trans-cinnamate dioxygenase ferredoxin reductase component
MTKYEYLIIGGGMAASAAIEGVRSVDEHGSIGVISAEEDRPYDRPPLSKDLWKGEASVDEIVHELPDGADFHAQRRIKSFSVPRKEAVDDQEQTYTYEKLLLATGGTPKRLPFDEDGQILYYRTLRDYRRLHELTEQYDMFAVVGGSFIGSELAAALSLNGKDVTMIFPEKAICGLLFPTGLGDYLNRYYKNEGVTVRANTNVTGLMGAVGGFTIETDEGLDVEAEVVVAGIGISPNTRLAEDAGLRVENGIIVNRGLQTSAPDIFAAGDVANFTDGVLGERRRVEHEDNAVEMGKAAGCAMAGAETTYDYSPMFYSDLFDLGYEAVGKLDANLDTYADWQEEYVKGVIYYLEEHRVRGVLLWNVWDQVDAARELIGSGKQWPSEDDLQGRLG